MKQNNSVMHITAFIPDRIFDGGKFITDHAVLVQDETVTAIVPVEHIPPEAISYPLPHQQLVPAFMDLQIYGGNGEMFSLFPSVASLTATYQYCMQGGASHFMATIPTSSFRIMYEAIDAVKDYWRQDLPGLLGLHLEGPYLNPAKKGAHLPSYIKEPTLHEVKELMKAGEGVIRMMTLAPECCSREIIHYLIDQGVLISAGHSNATYDQACEAFRLGISTATHLYNAMSPFQHRAPGLVGAVFDKEVRSSIVVDGIHVDYAAVRVAKKIMQERLFLITDAVTEGRTDSYTYIRQGDRYVTEQGTLAGSCLTMGSAVKNMITQVGVAPEEALRMASLYPAQVVGEDKTTGRIAPGYAADWAVLDHDFNVQQVMIRGNRV